MQTSAPDTNAKRDALISRIRKLAAMTQERGASESEATQAAALIARLVAEHNITRDELSIKADAQGCIEDQFTILEDSPDEWEQLPSAIAKLFECRSIYSTGFEDPFELGLPQRVCHFKFYGFPADVTAAVSLMAICITAVNTESSVWKPEGSKRKATQKQLTSFRVGMIRRLIERVRELTAPPPAATGTALIVLKNQLVNEQLRKAYPHLGYHNFRANRVADPAAYAAGQRAGNKVGIARGHVGPSGPKRLS